MRLKSGETLSVDEACQLVHSLDPDELEQVMRDPSVRAAIARSRHPPQEADQ